MNKKLEKLDNVVFFNEDIDHGDIDSDIIGFFSDGMGYVTIDINYVNLDDNNLIKMILLILFLLELLVGIIYLNNGKNVKKIGKELISAAWL